MAKVERLREAVSGPPDPEELHRRIDAGWRLVALIWERAAADGDTRQAPPDTEIPYGLRISGDCARLEEDPAEMEVLALAMELIVQDRRLSQVAAELTDRGYRTRAGATWSPGAVFDLLPRLIEAGPRIFSDQEWSERRLHFLNLT